MVQIKDHAEHKRCVRFVCPANGKRT